MSFPPRCRPDDLNRDPRGKLQRESMGPRPSARSGQAVRGDDGATPQRKTAKLNIAECAKPLQGRAREAMSDRPKPLPVSQETIAPTTAPAAPTGAITLPMQLMKFRNAPSG